MSDKKERSFERVNTSGIPDDWDKAKPKEPGFPVTIPVSVLRWVCYSGLFALLLYPITVTGWQLVCGAFILGHFASQLNALINKKP